MTLENNWCLVFMKVIFGIITFFPLAAYVAFGIMFMVTDYTVCENHSPLWIYAVVTLSIILLTTPMMWDLLLNLDSTVKNSAARSNLIILLCILLGVIVYGAVVMFGGYTCTDMQTHGLWSWSLVSFDFQIVLVVITLCLLLPYCCVESPKVEMVIHEDITHREEYVTLV